MAMALRAGSFCGTVSGRLATPAAIVSEISHGNARDLPLHRHEASYFCLLVRGAYLEETGGRTLSYRPYSVAFHPPGITHRDRIGRDGATFFCIELTADWLADALETTSFRADFQPRFLQGDLSRLAARLYRLNAGRTLDAETIEPSLWELVGCLERDRRLDEKGRPPWLDRCIDMLRADYAEPLRVKSVAGAVGVHPVHLSREFRKRMGQTMGEYVHKLRVRAACAELEGSRLPLADIAAGAGFADQSHFCRVFKSLVGCSPGRFRESVSPI